MARLKITRQRPLGGPNENVARQRVNSGYDDHRGYTDERYRRDGRHSGKQQPLDTRRRSGPEGDGKGSPPPGLGRGKGVRGSPATHAGDAGRGAAGRTGKGDAYKGKPTKRPEELSHEWFERLGAD